MVTIGGFRNLQAQALKKLGLMSGVFEIDFDRGTVDLKL